MQLFERNMDIEIEKAFKIANFMTSLASQRRILNEEFEQSLLYYYDGCVFKATEQRIAFISAIIQRKIKAMVILDDNNTPCNITDIPLFYKNLLATYVEATNLYYNKYTKIANSKNIEGLLAK